MKKEDDDKLSLFHNCSGYQIQLRLVNLGFLAIEFLHQSRYSFRVND